ncbi:MAG: hypothetical protein AB7T06_09860 [Kofleriaceae bacterium]
MKLESLFQRATLGLCCGALLRIVALEIRVCERAVDQVLIERLHALTEA